MTPTACMNEEAPQRVFMGPADSGPRHLLHPRWLNIPCTDFLGRVVIDQGRVLRAVFPDKTAAALDLLATGSVNALMAERLIARSWMSNCTIEGAGAVVETERAPFEVPPDRFIQSCLRRALERWIHITLRLESSGLCLSDAHFGNFMLFGRNDPCWVDLGSIRPIHEVPSELPFRRFRFLWQGMLAPLLALKQRSRLARLAIGDFPYQGPHTASGEPPLSLDEFLLDEYEELLGAIGTRTGRDALMKTLDFAQRKLAARAVSAMPTASTPAIDPAMVHRLLITTGSRRVLCLGADAHGALTEAPIRTDTVVIDEIEGRLEQIAATLPPKRPQHGTTALYLQHIVNRNFMRQPLRADAVLAVDPFFRFLHESEAALDNIATTLARLTGKIAILTVPAELLAPLTHLLTRHFATVRAEPGAGAEVMLVCQHRVEFDGPRERAGT